jgi:hypothetical protein
MKLYLRLSAAMIAQGLRDRWECPYHKECVITQRQIDPRFDPDPAVFERDDLAWVLFSFIRTDVIIPQLRIPAVRGEIVMVVKGGVMLAQKNAGRWIDYESEPMEARMYVANLLAKTRLGYLDDKHHGKPRVEDPILKLRRY